MNACKRAIELTTLAIIAAMALIVTLGGCKNPLDTEPEDTGVVTGVTLSPATLELVIGQTERLTANIAPTDAVNKIVSWNADDSCVSVSDTGYVTAVRAGEATVTVTTLDGLFTATCVVTVAEPIIAVTGIILDQEAISLVVGASRTLTATVSPADATDKTVTWASDSPNASVSPAGSVTAISVGTARITATSADGMHSAQCEVTVTPVHVTGIALNKSATSIPLGMTERLVASLSPANATETGVEWSCAGTNASVAADGTVTAVALGSAVITARSVDGSFEASCTVTVIPVPVSGVSLDRATLSLQAGHSDTLTAEVHPGNAANQAISWSSSDNTIATVLDGQVFALKAGNATVTVTTVDGAYTASCVVTVTGSLSHTYEEVLPAATAMQNGLTAAIASNDPTSPAYAVLSLYPAPKVTCYLNGYTDSGYTLTGSVVVKLNADFTQGPMNGTVNFVGGVVSRITFVEADMVAPYSGTLDIQFTDGADGTVDLATGTYTEN